jgi:hypothetical protein
LGTFDTFGGREDVVFYIHAKDALMFAMARFPMGPDDIPWGWEDYDADVFPKAYLKRF